MRLRRECLRGRFPGAAEQAAAGPVAEHRTKQVSQFTIMVPTEWIPEKLDTVNNRFDGQSPQEVLAWGFETFDTDAVMGTGFGYSGVALMHLVSVVRPGATVFYLDTDLLFPETYELRDQLAQQLDVNIERVHSGVSLEQQEKEEGEELWEHNPDRCCFIRKVQPLQNYLTDKKAWITAIRRDQSRTRANTKFVEWNETNQVFKINPIASWSSEEVWSYIQMHDLPYNELHDQGYPSIGCLPCTDPVTDKDDERSGRWVGRSKTECGLHLDTPKVSS